MSNNIKNDWITWMSLPSMSHHASSHKIFTFPLERFVSGVIRVRSVCSKLHPGTDSITFKTLKMFLVSLYLLHRFKTRNVVTLVSLPPNKWTTLDDKRIFSEHNSLITSWCQTLLLGSIGKERVFKPFWNDQCRDISKSLLLPTKTDCVVSPLTSSDLSLRKTGLTSSSSMMIPTSLPNKNSVMTSFLSSMSTPVKPWKKDVIRTRKVRLYPTQIQKTILKQWMGTCRYVYNKTLHSIKSRKTDEKISFYTLRDKHVTQKNNLTIQPWELETPKDIRAGAVKDAVDAFFTLVKKIKERKLCRFDMRFRSKKQDSSIVIPKKTIQITDDGIQIFKKKFQFPAFRLSSRQKKNVKKAESDCRLQFCRNKWYLCIPTKVCVKQSFNNESVVACDPGVRKFQTVYSEQEMFSIGIKKEIKERLLLKIDHLRSLRGRTRLRNKKNKMIKKSKLVRYEKACYDRYHNLVSEMHNQLAHYLTSRYKVILLPHFESQEMVKGKNLRRTTKRLMLQDRHYQFKIRLGQKCEERGCILVLGTEEYTSKTCTQCGEINSSLGSSEMFECPSCSLKIDRDVNGARNIMIKMIMEKTNEECK